MKKQTIEEDTGSRVVWDNLKELARSLNQGVIWALILFNKIFGDGIAGCFGRMGAQSAPGPGGESALQMKGTAPFNMPRNFPAAWYCPKLS